jgi:transposase
MKYVGVDLHKHVIVLCVTELEGCHPKVVARRRFRCQDAVALREFFQALPPFQVVVEATAAYEWFFRLIEDLAARLVLAHPKKLRVIAESTRKSDKVDAQVLGEFLALDMIPQAYRPTPRVRQHRVLVRHRCWLQRRISSLKAKLRNTLGHYNADVPALFTRRGQAYLASLGLSEADRFAVEAMLQQWELFKQQLQAADRQLAEFAMKGSLTEREDRALLATFPQIGPVTIDVLLSELGDWRRFRSQNAVVAFAGLDPGHRQSSDKRLDLHISKEGSPLLSWAMLQAAWRLVRYSPLWRSRFEHLAHNTGSKKKAIVGVARRLLTVLWAMLRSRESYRLVEPAPVEAEPKSAGTSARARQEGARPSACSPSRRPSKPSVAGRRADATAKAEGARGRT